MHRTLIFIAATAILTTGISPALAGQQDAPGVSASSQRPCRRRRVRRPRRRLIAQAGGARRKQGRGTATTGASALARRELNRAQSRLARSEARARETTSATANQLLDRARDLVESGRRSLDAQQGAKAREMALKAQRILSRAEDALREATAKASGDRSMLQELDRRIRQATAAVSRSSSRESRRLLDQARSNQRRALESLRKGDSVAAQRYLHAGQRAALKALDQAK